MRVTGEELDQALNQVRAVFTPETVDRLRENDLFPEALHTLQAQAGNDMRMLGIFHQVVAGAVAVVNIATRKDREAGLVTSFVSQANLIRAGHVRGNLHNQEALRDLFPALDEQYGPADAETLRAGIAMHLASRFFRPEGEESPLHEQLLRTAVLRAAEVEGELIQAFQAPAVAREEVGVDEMLIAVNALQEVTDGADLSLVPGLMMIAQGACEFNVGLTPIQQVIRGLYPEIDTAGLNAITERTLAYLHQFNGQVVNQVFQEIGNDWLQQNALEYLNARGGHELDYDGDDDLDHDEPEYQEPAAIAQELYDFKM
ncbi:hypothetical protein B6S59_18065 [Pseudomonas sp. A46]|nr:hypothetical protein [Pseudomonas sp. A46]OWJ92864.1 hypothetical protein B6S59_18065 [Pseudomonas sp. A46]